MNSSGLPSAFDPVELPEDHPAIAAVVVHPRSSGLLSLPGEYSADSRPPRYHWKVASTDSSGVSVESVQIGTREHYVEQVKVQNYRDSPSMVELFWSDDAGD